MGEDDDTDGVTVELLLWFSLGRGSSSALGEDDVPVDVTVELDGCGGGGRAAGEVGRHRHVLVHECQTWRALSIGHEPMCVCVCVCTHTHTHTHTRHTHTHTTHTYGSRTCGPRGPCAVGPSEPTRPTL